MRSPRTFFLPLFFVTVISMTMAVIVAVYAARTAAVSRGIARAEEMFRASKCDRGFAQLVRISYWANRHPALVSRLRCTAIIGHVVLGDDDGAIVLADRVMQEKHALPRPETIWVALFQQAGQLLDPVWLKPQGGLTPDPQAGYKTMMAELERVNDSERLTYLETRLAALFGRATPRTATPQISDPIGSRTAPVATIPTAPTIEPSPVEVPDPIQRPDFGSGRFAVACGASIRVYSEAGKHVGELTPGTLLIVSELRKSNGGNIAVCRKEGAPETSTPLLVRAADLSLRDGNLLMIPDPVRTLLTRHGRLASDIRKQRRVLAGRNPHAADYRKATADYKAFIADVQRFTAQRDGATGDERMRFSNKLHSMKNNEPAVRSAYETSKKQYAEWKESHGSDATSDPQVVALQARLNNVASDLAQYDL